MSYRAPGPGRPKTWKGGYVPSHTFRRPDAGRYIVAEDRAGGDPRGYSESLGGLGTFRMASYSIWTADERSDQLNRFFDAVQATNGNVSSHRNSIIAGGVAGTGFWTAWQVFMRDYDAFTQRVNRAGSTGLSTSSDAILVELRGFIDRFNDLEARFHSLSGVSAPPQSDTRSQGFSLPFSSVLGTGGSIGLMVAAGVGVVGLLAVAVIATQARAVMHPLPNARRRKKRSR